MNWRLEPIALALISLVWPAAAQAQVSLPDKVIFDFEIPADLLAWSNLALPNSKDTEPPVRWELAGDQSTSGKSSLKLTFAGGRWPTITTTQVPGDWLPYQSFEADVTVRRTCIVGFTALQEKSERGDGWDAVVSRWTKAAFLQPGRNKVIGAIKQPNDYAIAGNWGKVVRFEIFMYAPHAGESIFVDNIRLTSAKAAAQPKRSFTVAGTDWTLSGVSSANAVIELGKKFKDKWTKPPVKTVADHEAEMRAQLAELKAKHPRAVLTILRDGEKGYDPTRSDTIYTGWKDAYFNSHGPDGMFVPRSENRGKSETHEVFMRHRSPLMRVDLTSVPEGAKILAARLMIVRANDKYLDDHNPEKKATMWVVEPCLRPWREYEVNAFEFAKDKFWKDVGGMRWEGDADFAPIFLAYGPGQGKVNAWDFTAAVRYWTSDRHPNHGFMLHGDSHDYITAFTREAKEIHDRPAVIVIYDPL